MNQETEKPARWELSSIYPGLESPEFAGAVEQYHQRLQAIDDCFAGPVAEVTDGASDEVLSGIVNQLVDLFNAGYLDTNTIGNYIRAFVATDAFDTGARRILSLFERDSVRFEQQRMRLRGFMGEIAHRLPQILLYPGAAQAHAFILREMAEQSQHLMSEAEESLAGELSLSGAIAWQKLQFNLTSQMSVAFELDGIQQELPMPALINLRSHPGEEVRRRAYQAEMGAWDSAREPLAAALNGVKGAVSTLNRRRGREDDLHGALEDARIDRKTLEAMLGAMQASFPMFRRYFQAKAARLGKERLAWWDLFAPSGKTDTLFDFAQARSFIIEQFTSFTPSLGDFARRAFDHNWIDAEQRPGKRGGAFCMSLPGVRESRILCNFDGSLDGVFTVAHELGHAFHNECAYQAGKTELQRVTPMILAETASIMCATLTVEAVLNRVSDPAEELAILETSLIGDSQVIVDIYSRYLFEKEVFERRSEAELSAEDFCLIMERAQKDTYGEGLDERYLHKYMWTWKPHYYRPNLSYYNFPYAFGLLFGLGLYAIYQQRGAEFVRDYQDLLAATGEVSPLELAARFGIDIRRRDFWEESLKIIARRVARYQQL